jgi:hypothetical protein
VYSGTDYTFRVLFRRASASKGWGVGTVIKFSHYCSSST